ncbi:YceI family protein [Flavimarina sp. Hel_I_48]|uniref:YceI family protein n=1 Tax=Flavimarina sp. Hel_I_48 TaxID=1392488 RepID=UPI0004DF4121|nr:YceI family protein [Flavimarina sp. Hel_I_48]
MKIKLIPVLSLAVLLTGMVSCKDSKNKTEAGEAEVAAETSMQASKFMVDTQASTITWEGNKPTGTHTGTVNLESGVVKVAGDSLSGSFLIDMTTITDTDLEGEQKTNLEQHLKGTVEGKEGDFFNVQKYPTAAFEITDVMDDNGKQMLEGNLTIKDAKNNISFPVTYSVDGSTMTLKSEPFTIDRTKWNVNYGSKSVFDDLGDKFISDDITLTIDIVAKKQM